VKLFSRFNGLSLPVIAFVGLLSSPFLGIGLYEAYETRKQLNAFTHTTGTVVDNSYSTSNHDGTLSGAYYPVVEFTDTNGTLVRFMEGVGSLPPDYTVGDQVAVVYDHLNPKDARIYTWKRIWFAPTLFIVVGLLPIVITVVIMTAVRRSLTRARGSA
jgi:hypothetical protein